jgi:hypothetical protein
MDQVLTGTIRGNTIILDASPSVPDGQHVEVVVRTLEPERPWGEGIRNSAGGWANHPELDAVMEQIHAERALERRSANAL